MNFRKLLTYLAVGTAAVIPFAGAQNPTILQGSYISNVFGQSNFILNPNAQTNVANVTTVTATVTRSTTTPLVATSEFNVAIGTANGTATWATRAFDAGMKGQNCEARFTYRGFAATSKVHIKQGANTVATLNLTPATDPRIASINFPCGDLSTATTFVVTDTAILAGTNEIGAIYTGLATNQANVAQASKVGGWDSFLCGGESTLTTGTGVWSAPNVAGSCSGTPVGLASAALSNLNTLTFGFSNLPPGEYVFMIPAYVYPTTVTSGTARCDGRIKETTLSLLDNGNSFGLSSTTSQFSIGQITQFKFQNTVTANRIFQIELNRSNGLGNCNAGTLNFQQNVSLYRFPTSSELVVTPERQNTFAGLLAYSGSATNAVTSSSWTKLTASATLNRELFGKADTTASNDLSLTIKNLPVGTYEIKTSGAFQAQANSAGDATFCTFGISDLSSPTNPLGATQISSFGDASTTQPTYSGGAIVAIYRNAAVTDKTFTLFAKRLAGSGNCSAITVQADRPISFTITPLDQPSNSALYVEGPVKASATGAAIPSGYQHESKICLGSRSFVTNTAGVTGWSLFQSVSAGCTLTPGIYRVKWTVELSQTSGTSTGQKTAVLTTDSSDGWGPTSNLSQGNISFGNGTLGGVDSRTGVSIVTVTSSGITGGTGFTLYVKILVTSHTAFSGDYNFQGVIERLN